jgi:hypothetical protein
MYILTDCVPSSGIEPEFHVFQTCAVTNLASLASRNALDYTRNMAFWLEIGETNKIGYSTFVSQRASQLEILIALLPSFSPLLFPVLFIGISFFLNSFIHKRTFLNACLLLSPLVGFVLTILIAQRITFNGNLLAAAAILLSYLLIPVYYVGILIYIFTSKGKKT